MKTRENELHEPKIERYTAKHIYEGYDEYQYTIEITCPVCRHLFAEKSFVDTSKEKREYFENGLMKEVPNYCPNCGARLKKVEK